MVWTWCWCTLEFGGAGRLPLKGVAGCLTRDTWIPIRRSREPTTAVQPWPCTGCESYELPRFWQIIDPMDPFPAKKNLAMTPGETTDVWCVPRLALPHFELWQVWFQSLGL